MKGDQALNRDFNHRKCSTLYYKVFGKVNCHFSSVILCLCICLSDAGTANVDGVKDTNGTTQLCDSKMSGNAQGVMLGCGSYSGLSVEGLKLILPLNAISNAGLHDQNFSASKEIAGKGGSFTPNGFPPSGSCLSTGQDREQNDQPSDAKQNPVGSGLDKVTPSVPRGETCAFLSEASVEVPVTCEINSTNTGSENSSSMPSEELSRDMTRSSKRNAAGKTSDTTEKQPARKLTRYNRRGGGRRKQR
ncbi:hypothetical protein Patl1_12692 [Pistacia atlantica]|uniref:Uncharacterized protein n=1 Tax=Pistacia atlantica TaxID=434234 RepID=A0ACC1ASU3_9ROSI|nr:hypothetical protein Patl1_12692 [Pistacia atlantica]